MTAVEVLDWLNTADEETLVKVFDCTDFEIVFDMYTSQKIVDLIEKYEAEKNELVSNTDEFKVGDLVEYSVSYYGNKYNGIAKILKIGQAEITGNIVYGIMITEINEVVFASEKELKKLEHAEPPKEEKQKIEKISLHYLDNISIKEKLDELVDVVNELRGV